MNAIRAACTEYHKQGNISKSFQEGLKASFAIASKQDQDLFTALDLIIHHNIPIHKFKNLEFSRHFNWKQNCPPCYQTIVDTMVELFIIINDKIADEMED